MVRQLEPMLTIRIKCSEVFAEEIGRRSVTQHGKKGGVCLEQLTAGIATADAIRSVGNHGTEIHFGAAQPLLRGPKGRVEPANQRG